MSIHQPVNDGTLSEKLVQLVTDMNKWKPHIEKAMKSANNSHTFDDILRDVLNNRVHFYDLGDCCVLMLVENYPQHSVYHCFIACGAMQAIVDAEPMIRANAKELGCKYMTITGRTGWPKALKKHGWHHSLSTLYKEV